MFSMLMAYNVGYGEWKDGSRYEQIKVAVHDSVTTMPAAADPVWQYILPGLLRERRLDASALTPELEHELHRSLPHGVWSRILPRIGMSRFFGPLKRFLESEAENWNERLYGLMVASLDLGVMEKAMAKEDRKKESGEPVVLVAATTAAAAKREALIIKQAAKNPVYHAFLMYCDVENRFKQWIIAMLSQPLHDWHSSQNVELRSTKTSFIWLVKQPRGGFMEHIKLGLRLVHQQTFTSSGASRWFLYCRLR